MDNNGKCFDAEKEWLIQNCINARHLALRAGADEYNDSSGYVIGLEHIDESTRSILATCGWLWYESNYAKRLLWSKTSIRVKSWYDRAETWLTKNDLI